MVESTCEWFPTACRQPENAGNSKATNSKFNGNKLKLSGSCSTAYPTKNTQKAKISEKCLKITLKMLLDYKVKLLFTGLIK